MENSYRDKQRKSYNLMRTVYNITMGLIILGIGIVILVVMLYNNRLGLNFFESMDPWLIYAFSGLCIVYGAFRLYRGIKKDY
jgi:FtsH-binding integral membrane protein